MNVLQRRVGQVRRRLFWNETWRALRWSTAATFGVATAALVLNYYGWAQVDRGATPVVAAVAGLAIALLRAWWKTPGPLASAVELDRRCALDESVSTTLALECSTACEPAVRSAVRDDAERRVAAIDVSQAFPMRPTRTALWPLAWAAPAGLAAYLLAPPAPTIDPTLAAAETTSAEIRAEVSALEKKLDEKRAEAEKLQLTEAERLLDAVRREAEKLGTSPPADAKEALVALNDLAKQLEERRQALEQSSELRQQLSRLRSKKHGPAEKFADALGRGQFQQAAEQLGRLREELQAGKLDEARKKDLGEHLEQLQKQLDQLAEAQEERRRELERRAEERRTRERSGTASEKGAPNEEDRSPNDDGRSADDAELAESAEAAAQAAAQQEEQLERMARSLADASAGMRSGDDGKAREALERMQQQFDQLARETAESELLEQGLQDVADCKSGLCRNRPGENGRPGDDEDRNGRPGAAEQAGGAGGLKPGDGPGAGAARDPHDDGAKSFDTSARSRIGQGGLRAVGPADGPNSKGRVLQTIERQAASFQAGEAAALESQPLDGSRRRQKRQYFDALRSGD